jgi:hypothetical protein
MKNFLHSHPTIIIGTLAAALVIVLVSFYSWAIDDVFAQMDRALTSPSAQSAIGFDLPGAAKLDLRGLMDGNVDATPVPAPMSVTASPAATSTRIASSSTSTP